MRLSFLLVAFLCGQVLAEEQSSAPEEVMVYAEASRAYRWDRIRTLRERLPNQTEENRPATEAAIEGALLIDEPVYKPIERVSGMAVGDLGYFRDDESWRVVQVIDEKNCIVDNVWLERVVIERRQIGNKTVPIYDRELRTKTFWLANLGTSRFADEQPVELPKQCYHLSENRTYDTVAGSTRTVPVIEPYDLDEWKQLFTRHHELREWKSAGGHTTRAVLDDYQRRQVLLRNAENKLVKVPLSRLSAEDRDFVKRWRETYGDLVAKEDQE